MGLHPWHPDVQRLTPLQLHWVVVQSTPGARQDYAKQQREALDHTATDFVAWYDDHVSS